MSKACWLCCDNSFQNVIVWKWNNRIWICWECRILGCWIECCPKSKKIMRVSRIVKHNHLSTSMVARRMHVHKRIGTRVFAAINAGGDAQLSRRDCFLLMTSFSIISMWCSSLLYLPIHPPSTLTHIIYIITLIGIPELSYADTALLAEQPSPTPSASNELDQQIPPSDIVSGKTSNSSDTSDPGTEASVDTQQGVSAPAAASKVPLNTEELSEEAAKKLLEEEEERRKARRRGKGRIRELEEIRSELAEKELVLLEKEQELLDREQTLMVLREELEIERKLRTLLTKEKEKAEEEAALAMGLCMGGSMLP